LHLKISLLSLHGLVEDPLFLSSLLLGLFDVLLQPNHIMVQPVDLQVREQRVRMCNVIEVNFVCPK